MTLLVFALILGLDNMAASAGLGGLGLTRRRRFLLVAGFACAEGLLPIIGLWFGAWLFPETTGSWFLLLAGLLVLAGCLWGDRLLKLVTAPASLLILPLALGLDNLAAGTAFGALGLPVLSSALILGITSAAACWLGLIVGKKITDRVPMAAPLLSGSWLVLFALFSMVRDVVLGG